MGSYRLSPWEYFEPSPVSTISRHTKDQKVIRNHQRSLSKVTASSVVETLGVWTRESCEAVYPAFSKAFNAVSLWDTSRPDRQVGVDGWTCSVGGKSGRTIRHRGSLV